MLSSYVKKKDSRDVPESLDKTYFLAFSLGCIT